MTSHASPGPPVPVDPLGSMDNGLVSPSYAPPCIGAHRTVRHSAELSVFRCAMLAFIRDPFMTSHASPGPVPVPVYDNEG